jgi:sporulation protein YlmC with PRC-barrel domain
MLHTVKDLRGDRIAARDGNIGKLDQLYFDDADWRVRYFVVDAGSWLEGRKVLISPVCIDRNKSSEHAIAVALSRAQVEHSPDIDADKPVDRQYEEAYARYYGIPLYWAAPEAGALPTLEQSEQNARRLKEAERRASQSHLRSSDDVVGYSIRATDGKIGHVEDLRIDDRNWAVADLVVDTRDWLPGKKVLIPPSAVDEIDWSTREVRLRVRRDEVQRASPAT